MIRASLASSSSLRSTGFTQSTSHAVTSSLTLSGRANNRVEPPNPGSTWNSTVALPAPSITGRPGPVSTYNSQPIISHITTSATSPDSPDAASQPLKTTESTKKSDWSVVYNPEINRCLSLHVANTFALPASVFCTKFSRDGKYLAVGLKSGETYVYDILTGSKRSIVSNVTCCPD